MGVQKKSSESDIKQWDTPKLIVLDISDTRFGQVEGQDGQGFDSDEFPTLS